MNPIDIIHGIWLFLFLVFVSISVSFALQLCIAYIEHTGKRAKQRARKAVQGVRYGL